MSVNYSVTKASEKELKNEFFKYYKHVFKSWNLLADVLEEKNTIELKDLEKFFELEEKSNKFKAYILDQCIWNISRNQPLATHLRFLIAIIYSINDLERMADYVIGSARYLYSFKVETKAAINLLVKAMRSSILTVDKLVKLLKNRMNIKKNYIRAYHNTVKLRTTYREEYNKLLKSLSNMMFKQDTVQDVTDIMTGFAMIMKYTERNVDHAVNIVENFIYIRNADFFFDKKSKQEIPNLGSGICNAMIEVNRVKGKKKDK